MKSAKGGINPTRSDEIVITMKSSLRKGYKTRPCRTSSRSDFIHLGGTSSAVGRLHSMTSLPSIHSAPLILSRLIAGLGESNGLDSYVAEQYKKTKARAVKRPRFLLTNRKKWYIMELHKAQEDKK